MKPLFWTSIPVKKCVGSFWMDLNDAAVPLDLELLENTFSKQAAGAAKKSKKSGSEKKKAGPVSLVDPKRQQNVGIGVSRFAQKGITHNDLKRAVLSLNEDVLTGDRLNSLMALIPTTEELDAVTSYQGDKSQLGAVERFFIAMSEVPRLESRLQALAAKVQFDNRADEISNLLVVMLTALKEIGDSEGFRRVLEVILAVGNYVNGTSNRGGAFGFTIDSLPKLSATKAANNKTTLLQVCARLVTAHDAEAAAFVDGMENVAEASQYSITQLEQQFSQLKKGITVVKQELDACGDDKAGERFRRVMAPFLSEHAAPLMEELLDGVEQLRKGGARLAGDWGEDAAKMEVGDLFQKLHTFFSMWRTALAANELEDAAAEKARKRAEREQEKEAAKALKEAARAAPKVDKDSSVFDQFHSSQKGNADDIVNQVRFKRGGDGAAQKKKVSAWNVRRKK